jgi:hypothetical protein
LLIVVLSSCISFSIILFLENHGDCKNVAIIEEIIKNVKTSSMFTETEHLIKELIDNIGKIRQNRETNSSDCWHVSCVSTFSLFALWL